MTSAQTQLSRDFPEKSVQLQKLCQENPVFALKAEQYEALSQRIASESLEPATLDALKQEQASLKSEISRKLNHSAGSCCGGCGG